MWPYFRSYLVPSYATAKREEAEALDVLAQVLGGGSNSRLYRRLVVDKLATNAGAAYQGSAVDPTRLSGYVTLQPGVALPDIENEIDTVIAEWSRPRSWSAPRRA